MGILHVPESGWEPRHGRKQCGCAGGDLGRVCESARVRLNGRAIGTVWCAPFWIPAGAFLRAGRNRLQADFTNLAANWIADLDRRGVDWKRFHEINFVNREYQPFDASGWPLRDSSLLGPVCLIPVRRMRFS